MAIEIIEGEKGAVMYCNTTMWAFGPIFRDGKRAALDFQSWLGEDPRGLDARDLEAAYSEWMDQYDPLEA